ATPRDRRLAAQTFSGRKNAEALVRSYDRPRDLVVDRLPLRVPQLPQPPDGADDADGEPDLDHPDECAQHGFAHVGVLAGGHVTHLEPEDHHPDRLAARAPEVAEVCEVGDEVDDAGEPVGLLEDGGDDGVDDQQDDEVDQAPDDPQAWAGQVPRHRHRAATGRHHRRWRRRGHRRLTAWRRGRWALHSLTYHMRALPSEAQPCNSKLHHANLWASARAACCAKASCRRSFTGTTPRRPRSRSTSSSSRRCSSSRVAPTWSTWSWMGTGPKRCSCARSRPIPVGWGRSTSTSTRSTWKRRSKSTSTSASSASRRRSSPETATYCSRCTRSASNACRPISRNRLRSTSRPWRRSKRSCGSPISGSPAA